METARLQTSSPRGRKHQRQMGHRRKTTDTDHFQKRSRRRTAVPQPPRLASLSDITAAFPDFRPHHVEVYQRTDGMGRGVRALREFRAGDVVAIYGGRVVPTDLVESDAYETENYADYVLGFATHPEWCIDAHPRHPETRGHYGHLANDATGPLFVSGARTNAAFVEVQVPGGRIAMVLEATRRIQAGQDVWVRYGRSYWTSRRDVARIAKQILADEEDDGASAAP